MKKIQDQNVCIRINRDGEQILRCKEHLQEVNLSLTKTAQIFSLAGNEVRLKILLLLHKEKKLCVCDLSEVLNMKIPAVSQHLRKLKDASLVYTEREGTVIFYHVHPIYQFKIDTMISFLAEPVLV